MKSATVALVVSDIQQAPALVDTISDDREIHLLEDAIAKGELDPLALVYEARTRMTREEEEFGDYIEQLLSHPFTRPEVQEHGVQWLKSKIRIEQFEKSELEAAKIIANYAFKVFLENPAKTDFFLAGPHTQVRIRIFKIAMIEANAA